MKTVVIDKAQATVKAEPTESVTIVIDTEMRDFNILDLQDIYMSGQAKTLETALWNSLPGGTYDRLFAAMCFRKASHFRVPNSL